MAKSMIADLLKTPEQVKLEEQNILRQRGLTDAQALLTGTGGSPISGAIRGLTANALMNMPQNMQNFVSSGMMGLSNAAKGLGAPQAADAFRRASMSPEQQKAEMIQKMGSTIANDPEGIREFARKLRQQGRLDLALRLEEKANDLEIKREELKIKQDELEIKRKKANSPFAGEATTTMKDLEFYATTGFNKSLTDKTLTPDERKTLLNNAREMRNKDKRESWEEAGDKVEEKTYRENRSQAISAASGLTAEVDNIDKALDLATEIGATGGWLNQAKYNVESVLGVVPANKAEFILRTGEVMYQRLKPLFGGVISEGERKAVEDLYATLQKNPESNVRVLKALRNYLEMAAVKAQTYLKSKNYKQFNVLMEKQIEDILGNLPKKGEKTPTTTAPAPKPAEVKQPQPVMPEYSEKNAVNWSDL
jgi:hypothetical protein